MFEENENIHKIWYEDLEEFLKENKKNDIIVYTSMNDVNETRLLLKGKDIISGINITYTLSDGRNFDQWFKDEMKDEKIILVKRDSNGEEYEGFAVPNTTHKEKFMQYLFNPKYNDMEFYKLDNYSDVMSLKFIFETSQKAKPEDLELCVEKLYEKGYYKNYLEMLKDKFCLKLIKIMYDQNNTNKFTHFISLLEAQYKELFSE